MSKTTSKGNKVPPPAQMVSCDSDDSDFESEDAVTNVQLGLSDGQVEGDDESNPLISRIGGKAAWLPTQEVPPPSVSHCKYCNTPMELLVQIFAPLEKSPYDRTLLAWGCCRPACQRKGQGSLRVIRHLQFNARWAARLEKQRQKKQAREERKRQQLEEIKARKAEEEAKSKINPFSAETNASTNSGLGGGLFGGGFGSSDTNPFGSTTAPASNPAPTADEYESDSESESDIDSEAEEEERLADELAMKAAVEEASSSSTTAREGWKSQSTSYQPSLYLSTIPESSSSAKAGEKAHQKAQQSREEDAEDDDNEDDTEMKSFEKEGYEKMMLAGMDDVLERFIARVGAEGRQVVRYEMGGQPLPFSAQGELYKQLWPTSSKTSKDSTAVSRANHQVNNTNTTSKPTYDSSRIPPCEICGSNRTFEFQLMPNLVNTLRANQIQGDDDTTSENISEAEDAKTKHQREVEAVLGKSLSSQPNSNGVSSTAPMNKKTGLCWSTAMIFVCEKDCCIPNYSTKEGETWREEWVGIQFED